MSRRPALEAVVVDPDAAAAAEGAGAHRLELCADLDAGGITPAPEVLDAVLARVRVPVFVMIRPRAGDFIYSGGEIAVAVAQLRALAALGAAGIVAGALRTDGSVDIGTTRRFVDAAEGRPVTFHRAFDCTLSLPAALEGVVAAGVTRVLTSGGAARAAEGIASIADLIRRAGDRVTIMPGGGVRAHNVAEIVARTGAREVHARFESSDQLRAIVAACR